LNNRISNKDKKDWNNFINSKEKLPNKDLKNNQKKIINTKSLDLHGYTLEDANKKIENFILENYQNGITKLLVVTGKGLHSDVEKNPYVSKKLSILKYSIPEFIQNNSELNIEKPLIQLTTNEEKFKKLEKFIYENNDQNLRILERNSIFINNINKAFQTKNIKGMISFKDGRINPFSLLQTLNKYLKYKKIYFSKGEIIKIRKSNNQWISTKKNNENIKSDMVILCNSLKAIDLIDNLSHKITLKPVLGQAMEIDINDAEVDLLSLPKQFNVNGKNIIPKSKNKLIIGSTDEYSTKPEENTFEKLTNFLDKKPNWLMKGKISKKWYGIRSRPDGEPSPIMKNLEDGLIICTGFYKNGILLAPACS